MTDEALIQQFKKFIRTLNSWAALPNPGPAVVHLDSENGNMLNYSATFTPSAPDVVSVELTVDVNGTAQPAQTIAIADAATFSADQGATVTLTQVQIDDVGNRSAPHVQTFTATDTIAPPEAGDAAVTLVSET